MIADRRTHNCLTSIVIRSLRIETWFRAAQVTVEREIAGECRDLRRRSGGLQCGGSESEVELGDRLRVEAEPCLVWVLRMLWEKRTIHPGDHCRFSPEQVKGRDCYSLRWERLSKEQD